MLRGAALTSISAVNDNPAAPSQPASRDEVKFAATVFPRSVPCSPTLGWLFSVNMRYRPDCEMSIMLERVKPSPATHDCPSPALGSILKSQLPATEIGAVNLRPAPRTPTTPSKGIPT